MKFYQNENFLWKCFVDERMSLREIADEAGCSHETVRSQLQFFGIKRPKEESVNKKKPKKQTQTLKEAFDKVQERDKLIDEAVELGEIIKVLEGKPSTYVSPSPSEVEANRQKAHAEARKERYQKLKEDEEYERRRRGATGDWHVGNVEQELADIMYDLGERI
ncbi:hypothetical protein ES703_26850 [subsurface metagenome]